MADLKSEIHWIHNCTSTKATRAPPTHVIHPILFFLPMTTPANPQVDPELDSDLAAARRADAALKVFGQAALLAALRHNTLSTNRFFTTATNTAAQLFELTAAYAAYPGNNIFFHTFGCRRHACRQNRRFRTTTDASRRSLLRIRCRRLLTLPNSNLCHLHIAVVYGKGKPLVYDAGDVLGSGVYLIERSNLV